MSSYDQARGSRETYERLADPAMYWTQANGEPIREPIRRTDDETAVVSPAAHQETAPTYDEQRPSYDPPPRRPVYDEADDEYREEHADAQARFGGVNWGAAFFGWVVTVGVATLLAGIVAAGLTFLSGNVESVSSVLESDARTTALVAAASAVAVLMIAYYSGGYVAGRMSRFDGGKQGAGVWVTGLMLTGLAAGLALVFAPDVDLLSRVDLPSVPLSERIIGIGGIVVGVAVLLGSLLAGIAGGKVGCRYHRKVDEYL